MLPSRTEYFIRIKYVVLNNSYSIYLCMVIFTGERAKISISQITRNARPSDVNIAVVDHLLKAVVVETSLCSRDH